MKRAGVKNEDKGFSYEGCKGSRDTFFFDFPFTMLVSIEEIPVLRRKTYLE